MSDRLLVLAWHNVEPSWLFPFPPGRGAQGMRRQFAFLGRYANVVDLGEALAALRDGRPLPPRAVAITFDDGYRDQLELAAPLLASLGLPATFFLVPGLLSRQVRPWWERIAWTFQQATRGAAGFGGVAYPLGRPAERRAAALTLIELLKRCDRAAREAAMDELEAACAPQGDPQEDRMFLDWDGARRLLRPSVAIGSHSQHHSILSQEDAAAQARDLAQSRQELERRLGVEVALLAYPNGRDGDYDQATVAAARQAGYGHAITTLPGWNGPATPPYEIRRFVQQPERGVPGLAIVPLHPVRRRVPLGSWRTVERLAGAVRRGRPAS